MELLECLEVAPDEGAAAPEAYAAPTQVWLGTVEVRALDSQSSLSAVAGIVALVHSLASWATDRHGPGSSETC